MTLTKTTDHVGEALAHLVEQFKNKPKMAAFLTALVNQVQDLEDASFEVFLDRWIDTAVGVQLDGVGAIIGESRQGRGDDAYRLAIKARIQINFSEATPEDILTALVNFYNRTYQMIEIPPAAFIIRLVDAWVSSTDPDPQDFVELLNSVNGAGIKAWFQYSLVDDDEAFTFASGDVLEASETQGFGVDGIYVAVSSTGTNRVMTSVDGITWTAHAAAEDNEWQSVTHGGLFVAVASTGTNRVMTSPDGITWTSQSAAEANEWRSVTFGAGLFVAVASSGTNRVMTSPDGITWTSQSAAAANEWRSVTFGAGLFVAVSSTGDNRVMTSLDGITWTARTAITAPNLLTDGDMEAVGVGAWTTINVVLTKQGSAHSGSQCLRAAQTIAATSAIAKQTILTIGKTYRIKGWARSDGILSPQVRDGSQTLWNGSTSVSWQEFDVVFVAGHADTQFRSLNGVGGIGDYVEFDTASVVVDNAWESVIYGDGLFVAVSSTGDDRVMTSPDGVVWTARTAAEANAWRSVTHDEGLFVAVSSDGTNRVMTSPDGITWTTRVAAEPNEWQSVAHDGGLFVAVASNGTNQVMTSPGGTVWTARAEAEANAWESIGRGYATGGIMSEIVEV